MSILDRFSLDAHLDDAELAAAWSAAALQPDQRPVHTHLEGCSSCRARYNALDAWLRDLGTTARAEADEAFPADRLAAQHAQVMRRLEGMERPGRVIVFPRNTHAAPGERTGARRWVAAAAAAGVVVGIAAGQLLDLRDALGRPNRPFVQQRTPEPVTSVAATQPAGIASAQSDEAFLTELDDAALSRPVPELAALDAVTPRLRDITERPR